MFKHKANKILEEGQQGRGAITDLRLSRDNEGNVDTLYISALVQFDNGMTTQAEYKTNRWDWDRDLPNTDFETLENFLQPGEEIPIRYSADRTETVLDLPALKMKIVPMIEDQDAATRQYRMEQAQSVLAGGAAPAGSASVGGGQLDDLLRQLSQDPQGLRQQLLSQSQGEGGAQVFVMTPQGLAPAGGQPAAPSGASMTGGGGASSGPSVADELSKLAQLRDQGIINEQEFEAQKAKLLGG